MRLHMTWGMGYLSLKALSSWIKNLILFCFLFSNSNLIYGQITQQVKRYYEETINGQIIGLEKLENGEILIATGHGIFLAPAFNEIPRQLIDYEISSMQLAEPFIIVISEGNILINRLDDLLKGQEMSHQFYIDQLIPEGQPTRTEIPTFTDALYYFPLDEIWLSTAFYGIVRLGVNQDSSFEIKEGLYHSGRKRKAKKEIPSNRVNTLLLDENANIWIGTDNGLCIHRPNHKNKDKSEERKWIFRFSETKIRSLVLGKKEEVWIMSSNKRAQTSLYLQSFFPARQFIQLQTSIKIQIDNDFKETTVYDMTIDNIGSLWFGSDFLGRVKDIANLERDSLTKKTDEPLFPTVTHNMYQGFSSNKAAFVEADKHGYIWIGTGGQGVFVLKKQPKVDIDIQNVKCHGESNGSITLTPIDGQYPFEIIYNSQKNGSAHFRNLMTSITLPNLLADTFEFKIIDAHQLDTAHNTVIIRESASISAALAITRELDYKDDRNGVAIVEKLKGGQVVKSNIGGSRHSYYSFQWNVQNNEGDTIFSAINENLAMGSFSVTIFDTLFCQLTLKDTLFVPQLERVGPHKRGLTSKFIINESNTLKLLECYIPFLKEMDPFMSLKIQAYYPQGEDPQIGIKLKAKFLSQGINNRRIIVVRSIEEIGIRDPYIEITPYASIEETCHCTY